MSKPKTDREKRIAELRKQILRYRNKIFTNRLNAAALLERAAFDEADMVLAMLELDHLRATPPAREREEG